MKVFVGWSGEFSKAMAGILHKFLPHMIQDLEVFVSHHDLVSGERWGFKLAKELEVAAFGILCLTPDNLHSDWLLFEAGALTKHADNRACALLFGVQGKHLTDPLLQFQYRVFEEKGMRLLLRDLNNNIDKPLTDIDLVFDKWWPDIDAEYRKELASLSQPPASVDRSDTEMLEEILLRVRRIERSLDSRPARPPGLSTRVPFISARI